jgi:hypothetical protein
VSLPLCPCDLAIPSVEWLYPISLGNDSLYLGCAQHWQLSQFSLPTACRYTHALRTYCYCSVILISITFSLPTACRDLRQRTPPQCSLHGSDILVQQELGRPALIRFVLTPSRENFLLIVLAYPREIRVSTLTKRDLFLHTRLTNSPGYCWRSESSPLFEQARSYRGTRVRV